MYYDVSIISLIYQKTGEYVKNAFANKIKHIFL